MSRNVYFTQWKQPRDVVLPDDPGEAGQILQEIKRLGRDCREAVLDADEDLKTHAPDIDDRCGVLGERYEGFAMTLAACGKRRLIVSVETADPTAPVVIHGIVHDRNVAQTVGDRIRKHRNAPELMWEGQK